MSPISPPQCQGGRCPTVGHHGWTERSLPGQPAHNPMLRLNERDDGSRSTEVLEGHHGILSALHTLQQDLADAESKTVKIVDHLKGEYKKAFGGVTFHLMFSLLEIHDYVLPLQSSFLHDFKIHQRNFIVRIAGILRIVRLHLGDALQPWHVLARCN